MSKSKLVRFSLVFVPAFLTVTWPVVFAQRATIPEVVARGGVNSVASVPSGQMPSLASLLDETDTVVVGTLGDGRSYLSKDETDVLTDYPLTGHTILFDGKAQVSRRPTMAPQMAVTQKGGTVVVNGVSFTQSEPALEPLKPGTRVLCLLKAVEGKNMIVETFFGIFSVEDGRVNPLMSREDFAPEYRGRDYREAVESMLIVLRARKH
jgi:hypothetical protein